MAYARTLYGTKRGDYYRGDDLAEQLFGLGGDDDIGGGGGDDYIDGGDGNDLIESGRGRDTLIGGAGIDALNYAGVGDSVDGGVLVDLSVNNVFKFGYGSGSVDTVSGFEVVIGSDYSDSISGSDADEDLRGGAGDDYLFGDAGDDTLRGDDGFDVLDGGDGFDYVDYFYTRGGTISLADGTATLRGRQGTDLIRNVEGVQGSRGNDVIIGDGKANHLLGWEGNDQLFGGDGDDDLAGWSGRDLLVGGAGKDVLYGGADADRFVFGAEIEGSTRDTADRVADFSRAEGDRLDASGIDANTSTAADDGFRFIGTRAFSGRAGELRYYHDGGDTWIEGDVNGDRIADGVVVLTGHHDLVKADFIL